MDERQSQALETIKAELDKRRQQHKAGDSGARSIRRWIRRAVAAMALIFFALSGWFFLQFLRLNSDLIEGQIKGRLIPSLTKDTIPLQISRITGDLISGVELEGLVIRNPRFEIGGILLNVPRVSLKYSLADIFFGQLILESVVVHDPVLTLTRDASGLADWDFGQASSTGVASASEPGLAAPATFSQPQSAEKGKKDSQDQAEHLADRFLQHIELQNMSILIPKPRELIADRVISGLFRLPTTSWQAAGLHVLLRKFPKADFVDHIIKIDAPDHPNLARLQISRFKSSGNFNLTMDLFGENLVVDVKNIGQDGRAIQIFDGRRSERLKLRFVLGHPGPDILTRLHGLNGALRLATPDFIADYLPEGSKLSGDLVMHSVSPDDRSPIADAEISCNLTSGTCFLPGVPSVSNLSFDFLLKQHLGQIRDIRFDLASYPAQASGTVDLTAPDHILGSLTANIAGEAMGITGESINQETGDRIFKIEMGRSAGSLRGTVHQIRVGPRPEYRDLSLALHISDLIPSRLLPAAHGERFRAWISRVDLSGPLTFEANIPNPTRPTEGAAVIDLKGATIISHLRGEDRLRLDGKARLSSGSLAIEDVSAALDSLQTSVSGRVGFDASSGKISEYELACKGRLIDAKPFIVQEPRLRAVIGRSKPFQFKEISIEGRELLSATFSSASQPQTLDLTADHIGLKVGSRVWRLDRFSIGARANQRLDAVKFRPERLDLKMGGVAFGFPLYASASVNLLSEEIRGLTVTAKGEDFSTLISTLREIPAVDAALKKTPVELGGAFTLDLEGAGKLSRPAMSGQLVFPRLRLRANLLEAMLPCDISISTSVEGEYQGKFSTRNASLNIRQVPFGLDHLRGTASYGREKGSRENRLDLDLSAGLFGVDLSLKSRYQPRTGLIENAKAGLKSEHIETLASEVSRICKLNIPFVLTGATRGEITFKGKTNDPDAEGFLELKQLDLKIPMPGRSGRKQRLDVEHLGGKISFQKKGTAGFDVEVADGRGVLLGAPMNLSGKMRVNRTEGVLTPVMDGLSASIQGLQAAEVYKFLAGGLIENEKIKDISEVVGSLSGALALSGGRNRYAAGGEINLSGGGFRHASVSKKVEKMSGRLLFSRKMDKPEPVIEIRDATAQFGRAQLTLPMGRIIDPLGAAQLTLQAKADSVFPTDVMALLAGLKLPKISFPKEGALAGEVSVTGTAAQPAVGLKLSGGDIDVRYETDGNAYTVPIGKSSLALAYDLRTGSAKITEGILRFLNGELQLDKASGKITPGHSPIFSVAGHFDGIDLGSVAMRAESHLKGILGGEFSAEAPENGSREAELHLKLKNMIVGNLPFEKETIDKIGLDFLDEPEFRVGQINLYLSSEDDTMDRGHLRVADGLFAGPDMRIELGESAFDPKNMQLTGKIMFNPQPLRRTKLGRKLGSLTRVVQDKETGVPFIDLTVNGTWDNPGLIGKTITERVKKRAKKNFIKSIFGGRHSHKASVEELKEWFPGWEPGQ
ncbi:MAG: hypothetical protein HQM09_06530 [Candidatus Riflebacteria bacterium]|nr:hypothetical protein [Candidatus Riflebacteria bacterium]